MEKKKRKDCIYIAKNTLEEAADVLKKAVQAGKISFPPYESIIPEETFTGCNTTLDLIKAARETLSNRNVNDDELFELIKEDPSYLCDNFAQKKITQWQNDVNSGNKDKALDAQEKLRRISQMLARKNQRESLRFMFVCVEKRHEVFQKLKEHSIRKKRSDANKRLILKELFGANIIDSIPDIQKPDAELADIITANLVNTSGPMIEKYRKKKVKKLSNLPFFHINR
jgi:hypothetical protein